MAGVLVGVDGSPASTAALVWALREAEAHGAPLTLLYVVDPLSAAYGTYERSIEEAEGQLNKAVAELGHTPQVRIDLGAEIGRPPAVLVRRAKDADMLVVGSRGQGGVKGLVLGSVSTAVVHSCPVPVVVIPSPRS